MDRTSQRLLWLFVAFALAALAMLAYVGALIFNLMRFY